MKKIHVAAAIIRNKNKILIAKRDEKSSLAGYWEFPGGKIEPGETSFETTERELMEEMEIEVMPINEIGTTEYQYKFASVVITFVECKIMNGNIKLNNHSEFLYVDEEQIRNANMAPADIEIIDKLFTK